MLSKICFKILVFSISFLKPLIQGSVVSGQGSALYWPPLVVNLARSGWLTKFTKTAQ